MTKILLVEDDKSLREIYGVRLLAEGYDIVSAGDGEEALAMSIKERPDLIVSDVMMPKISGFDMLDILRSTTETRNIKVIMMTALSSEDQRTRGEQLGADRYLVKSQVGIEDVVRTVHEVLGDQTSAPVAPTPQAAPVTPAPEVPATPVVPANATTDETLQALESELTATPVNQTADTATPTSIVTPPSPAAAPTPATPSTLPQPTAPFSSPRPNTLGERIIHPLDNAEPTTSSSVGMKIEEELKAATVPAYEETPLPAPVEPAQPVAFDAPVDAPSEVPTPAEVQPEATAQSEVPAGTTDTPTEAYAPFSRPAPFSNDYHADRPKQSERTTAPTEEAPSEYVETPRDAQ